MVAFWPVFLLLNFGLLNASRFNLLLSQIFRWRICGSESGVNSAVVVPVEREFIVEEIISRQHYDVSTEFNNNNNFLSLLKLDPQNEEILLNQYEQCKISKADQLSNLCLDLLNYVTDFLDFDSNLNLRAANRRFLLNQIERSRIEFYQVTAPKISGGFDICHKSTLSASYFNRLERPLHHLLWKEKRKIVRFYYYRRLNGSLRRGVVTDIEEIGRNLDKVTKFIEFLNLSISFYRRTDLKAFWELIEALLKTRMLPITNFIDCVGFKSEFIFFNACRLGHLCIIKALFNDSKEVIELDLHNGVLAALSFGHLKVFKLIIMKMKEFRFNDWVFTDLLEKTVLNSEIEFTEFLLKSFDHFVLSDSSILSFAIRNRNLKMLELIISYGGNHFISNYFCFNLSAFELAAKFNFFEGIAYFLRIGSDQIDSSLIAAAIKLAIQSHAHESVKVLIEEVTRTNPLNEIYSKQTLSELLSASISYLNIDAMKIILERINSRSIDEIGLVFVNRQTATCNLIHYAVKFDFKPGFDLLISHFGIEALEETDGLGRTPFLLAVSSKNLYFALKIAELNPKSVMIPDLNGDTALHLMISSDFPLEFIKPISSLNLLRWDAQNHSLLTPFDILDSIKRRFPGKNFDDVDEFLFNCLNEN
jgi:hypothetical protein